MIRGWIVRLLLVVPLLAAELALGGPSHASAATVCDGNYLTGVIKDNIVVPPGSYCELDGATVRGGVTIGAGGELVAFGAEIRGSVSGTGISNIVIGGGVVRGSVTIAGSTYYAMVDGVEVRGDVALSGAWIVELTYSVVRGSASVNDNGNTYVGNNTIGANLTCAGNGPGSTYETNSVGGANNCPAV